MRVCRSGKGLEGADQPTDIQLALVWAHAGEQFGFNEHMRVPGDAGRGERNPGNAEAAVTALLDRLLHHAHVLKCGPRSWRTKVQTDLRTEDLTK
jgi:hypothetical protein